MSDNTYIIGHRNPDADAICSAIAYANYKHAKGDKRCIAARCGNTNARVDAILQRFRQPPPFFLGDVTPRVRDIMSRDIHKVSPGHTCAEALELIDRHDVRVLPVVDNGNHLQGMLTIFQLGDFFIPKPRAQRELRHVHASIADIVRSLHARMLHVVDQDRLEDLYVRVGAMDIRTFGNFAIDEQTPAGQSIIVVGDRYDIQTKSIHAGVRLLVITGNLQVEPEVVQQARDKNVCLVISPYDSATTSWIIRSASRVERVYDREVVTFTPDERVSVVRRRILNQVAPAYMVLNDDRELIGIFTKSDLLKPPSTQLILVDHNELTQAVAGADQVVIREIIDHHRLGNPHSAQPILFFNEPVGSTCTIVADMFRRDGLTPSPEIAGIMMSGIISDTLHLNSPTSTDKDADILRWLSGVAGVEAGELAGLIFASGSVILSSTPEEVIRNDMKVYEQGEISYSVSQVEELGFNNFWQHRAALEEALETVRQRENYYFAALFVTDINSQNSLLLVQGEQELIEQINYPLVEAQDVFELQGIVSRKKQLIPYFTTLLSSIGIQAKQAG